MRDDSEESVADLGKQMNVLVPVDEIRRPTKHIDKGAKLGRDFGNKQFRLEATGDGPAQDVVERQEVAFAQGRKFRTHRAEGRGQCDVQAEVRALLA